MHLFTSICSLHDEIKNDCACSKCQGAITSETKESSILINSPTLIHNAKPQEKQTIKQIFLYRFLPLFFYATSEQFLHAYTYQMPLKHKIQMQPCNKWYLYSEILHESLNIIVFHCKGKIPVLNYKARRV